MMSRPRALFHGRRRWPALALLVGLLSLLGGALALAQPPAGPPLPTALPAQSAARVFLPQLTSPEAPAPAGAPVIEAFQLSSAAGPLAAEVELRWRVRGATSLRVEPGVGDARGAASATVYPVATTTYTLTATNDKGSVTATATYTVDAPPTPNPLTVAARFDAGRAAAASIGPAGGSITAIGADGTSYTLSVPPEALVHTEAITLTPVAAIDGMPFAATDVRAVRIAPEGLLFIEPATLTFAPPVVPAGPQVGFAFQGAGAEFHLRSLLGGGEAPLAQTGAPALSVTSARSYGAAPAPGPVQLAPLVRRAPSNPSDAFEHTYNAAVDKALSATARRLLLVSQLRDEYDYFLSVQLEGSPERFDIDVAARSYIDWRARAGGVEELLRDRISKANLLLGEALRKAGELASERCSQGRPAQGFALQRYMAYAKRFGLVNTRAALEERLSKCWVFEVVFQSRMDQASDGVSALYELRSKVELAYRPGSGIVGVAPLTWQRFDIGPLGPGCVKAITAFESSAFLAEGAGLGLTLTPVSRTSPNVSFQLSYEVGEPTVKWTVTCPEQPSVPFSSPLWWVMYGEFHRDERAGQVFTARTANVNPNSFPGWIYTNALPSGEITERTEIALKHTPL